MTKRTCSIEGCGRKHKARGLCQAHALRLKKYGSVDAQRPIRPQSRPADERFWEKVEKTDACWLWTGCLTDGYGHFSIAGLRSDNASGARGVYWDAPAGKWRAVVGHYGRIT